MINEVGPSFACFALENDDESLDNKKLGSYIRSAAME